MVDMQGTREINRQEYEERNDAIARSGGEGFCTSAVGPSGLGLQRGITFQLTSKLVLEPEILEPVDELVRLRGRGHDVCMANAGQLQQPRAITRGRVLSDKVLTIVYPRTPAHKQGSGHSWHRVDDRLNPESMTTRSLCYPILVGGMRVER